MRNCHQNAKWCDDERDQVGSAEGKMHAGGLFGKQPLGPYGFWLQEQDLWDDFSADYDARMEEIIDAKYGHTSEANDAWYRDSILPSDAFADTYIGQRAVQRLNEVPDEYPWHLFVSFVGPHDPFDPPTEWADRFRSAALPQPVTSDGTRKPARFGAQQYPHSPEQIMIARRQYTALGADAHPVHDLYADPTEADNLIGTEPEVAAALLDQLTQTIGTGSLQTLAEVGAKAM